MAPNSPIVLEKPARRRRGRKKKPIEPRLQAHICRAHFHESKTYAEIREQLRRRGITSGEDSWFANLVTNARKQGLIFFDVDETFTFEGDELRDEAVDLRNKFDLDRAVVVQVPDPFESPPGDSTLSDQVMRADDYLHTVLANHAGKLLAEQLHPGGPLRGRWGPGRQSSCPED